MRWARRGARGSRCLPRRASLIQRHMLYRHQPDGLAVDLARYRAVTPGSIDRAVARWLDPARMVEIETVAAGPREETLDGSHSPA